MQLRAGNVTARADLMIRAKASDHKAVAKCKAGKPGCTLAKTGSDASGVALMAGLLMAAGLVLATTRKRATR